MKGEATFVVGLLLAVATVIVSLAAGEYYLYNSQDAAVLLQMNSLSSNTAYSVRSLTVMEANSFDVYLENEKRYLVALHGVPKVTPDAKSKVLRMLNEFQQNGGKLTLVPREFSSTEHSWSADIHLGDRSQPTISDWLQSNGLVYSR